MREHYEERDQRHDFTDDVYLVLPIEPWFLRLSMQGVNLSSTGVLTVMNPQSLGRSVSMEDFFTILEEGDCYHLQLNSAFEHIESPCLSARLKRKKALCNSVSLAFAFEDQDEQLFGLLHEIRQREKAAGASGPRALW